MTYQRPIDSHRGWAVVDVETSGLHPSTSRVISLAALAMSPGGVIEQTVVSLLDPGVDPGPTEIHGLTRDMLEGRPRFVDVAADLVGLLQGRVLVAHYVAFDYAFLAAEAAMAGVVLPVEAVMCTVELAGRLQLGTDNLKLSTLAKYWGITQRRPHDAFDDALVLTRVLMRALDRARELDVPLPVRVPGAAFGCRLFGVGGDFDLQTGQRGHIEQRIHAEPVDLAAGQIRDAGLGHVEALGRFGLGPAIGRDLSVDGVDQLGSHLHVDRGVGEVCCRLR